MRIKYASKLSIFVMRGSPANFLFSFFPTAVADKIKTIVSDKVNYHGIQS